MDVAQTITPVVLSGGSGSRLWPMSRPDLPKQFISLTGGERTMLQETILRTSTVGFGRPIVVASAAHADKVLQQMTAVDAVPARLILEPAARNTAAAIALAALTTHKDEVLLVMPSDHLIRDTNAFQRAVAIGLPLARKGMLVTFGIRPDRPETGYGYIEVGRALGEQQHQVERFVEKPDLATAQAYLDQGGYLWNAGIFLFQAGAFLEALRVHAPEVSACVAGAVRNGSTEGVRLLPDPAAFAAAPSISVDKAIMEHAPNVAVIPVDMAWSDIGSWDALYDIQPKDPAGNAREGMVVPIDSEGCLLRSDTRTLVAVGLKDLIVVESAGVILILPRSQAQRVREACDHFETLKADDKSTP